MMKKAAKQDREFKVLIGLVDYYLKTGKPVGSNSLKEAGFENFSSATIRNYFASLEEEGFLTQQHTSGGRIPTPKAYRVYANEFLHASNKIDAETETTMQHLRKTETKEIAAFLQNAAEALSSLTQTAVFLSAPRFDHDFIVDLKLLPIDPTRCLCVIITDFGVIRTEVLPVEGKITAFAAKRIETYFHWRLTGHDKPEHFEPGEEQLATKLYNELVLRYIVGYSNFIDPELYRTGFAKLLTYPEFHDAVALSNALSLFENSESLHLLVKDCYKNNNLSVWINDDLSHCTSSHPNCTVLAIPYYINQNIAGAAGILGPMRITYRKIFGILREFSHCLSEALTKNLYKFKITFRQPHSSAEEIQHQDFRLLLENRS